MMADSVTLQNLSHPLAVLARLSQRAGARYDADRAQPAAAARCGVSGSLTPTTDIAARVQLWCAAHGFTCGEVPQIKHDDDCPTAPAAIVFATTGTVAAQSLAVVRDGRASRGQREVTDDHFWPIVASVEITRLAGPGWTADAGRYLYARDGKQQSVHILFAMSVISGSRACGTFDDRGGMCSCSGSAVYYRACGRCWRIERPEMATMTERPR